MRLTKFTEKPIFFLKLIDIIFCECYNTPEKTTYYKLKTLRKEQQIWIGL